MKLVKQKHPIQQAMWLTLVHGERPKGHFSAKSTTVYKVVRRIPQPVGV